MHVTCEGATQFIATERIPRPLTVTLECPEGLPAGADVRLCSGTFHSCGPECRLEGIEVAGGEGRVVMGHGLPRGWFEKTQGGVGPAGGGLIGRPVGEVYLCTVQVARPLSPGARLRFRLGMTGCVHGAVQGALRVKLRAPCSDVFEEVGDDIALANAPGPPTRLEARVTADARDGGRLVVFATDDLFNPVPDYRGVIRLQSEPPIAALPRQVQAGEDGRAAVDGLVPAGTGPVRIDAVDEAGGCAAQSPPLCAPAPPAPLYLFGGLHFHTWLSVDGDRDPRQAYAYARDTLALDLVAMSDHAPIGPNWDECLAVNEEFYEPGRFVTLPAWECSNAYGHANLYLRTAQADAGPWLWDPDVSPQEMTVPDDAILVPHHTSAGSRFERGSHREGLSQGIYWTNYDWSVPNPRVRVMEIVQGRGCFEADEEDAEWGIRLAGRGSSARDALARGYRVGYIAGSDNHKGHPTCHDGGYVGMTCVRAAERTREAVWQAMEARHTYATSGVAILCDVAVNGHAAGTEAVLQDRGDVHLDARLHGTAPIAVVEVISAGRCVWHSEPGTWDVELSGIELPQPDGESACYYLRLRQADGHRAWVSPVWLDREPG